MGGAHYSYINILHKAGPAHRQNNISMVMDVSIVAGSRMEETWRLKTLKYSMPENTRAITTWLQSHNSLQHTSDHILQGTNVWPNWESTKGSGPDKKGFIGPLSFNSGWFLKKLQLIHAWDMNPKVNQQE